MTSSDKIPLAIIGLNYGRWIIESLLAPNTAGNQFRIEAVSDLAPHRARAMAGRTGARILTLEEVLADPGIRAVGLFTEPGGRASLIGRLIRAGKDVMTTKPFDLDAEMAMDVLEEARGLGRVIHLNSPSPLTPPDIVAIQNWSREFALGRPIGCRAETYATYNETADGSWYDDAERCPAAPIFRIGIYLINDLVCLFGEADAVQVLTSRIRTGRPTPDNAQMGILFRNGVIANVFASLCIDDGQRWSDSLILNYENGTIYRNVGPLAFGGAEGTVTLRLQTREGDKPRIEQIRHDTRSGQYQWEAFHRAIHGERIETPRQELVWGLRVVAAMARAEKSGRNEPVLSPDKTA